MKARKQIHYLLLVFLLFAGATQVAAQKTDQAYNSKIKEYTTDPRFLPESVLNLVVDKKTPSPLEYFGDIIGAPGVMHRTPEIYAYFRKLAEVSPYLSVRNAGVTEEGRDIILVMIGNEDSQKQASFYKNQLALLADPRKMGLSGAEDIIRKTKPVFYLNGGLHSAEMGSPEMLMELAYRLITGNSEEIKKIRDNIIVLINPVSEPDGRDKQVDWYYRYSKSRTEYDDGFEHSPPYWGKYVFHDNNRDGIQVSQQLTKAIYNIYYDWHPTVMLDLHESVPLIYMSTGTGPYNETIDPITIGEWQVMANHDITSLAAQGLPGAFTWAFYDGWYPGYALWIANNHNSIGRFYETFGNAGANTYLRDLSRNRYAGDAVTSREWYRPDPATQLVNWSSRNNINYMEAGVLASLCYTADNAGKLLHNFYQKGLNNIKNGQEKTPRAFIIPANQRDPDMAAFLVNQLRKQKIEVHRVTSGENEGDFVVLLDQPYRNLAVSLLSKQNYPKEAKFPPYDDIAWTLGYLYGVDVKEANDPDFKDSALEILQEDYKYRGKVTGSGDNFLVNYTAQNKLLSALYWLKSEVMAASLFVFDERTVIEGSVDSLNTGSVLIKGLKKDDADKLAEQFGVDIMAVKTVPSVKQHPVILPRIAVYHTWYDTQDEGWTRYTLEQYKIPYTSLDKDDLRMGGLHERFDVIIIPRINGSASDFINGISDRFGPIPYTSTEDFPSHGVPDSSEDITGGPGFEGMNNLREFAEQGGIIISLDEASSILAEAGLTPELYQYDAGSLFHPGSVVNVKIRATGNPVTYGFPELFPVFRGNGSLLEVAKYNRSMVILQYGSGKRKDEIEYQGPVMGLPETANKKADKKDAEPDEEPYVLSGMVRNEEAIIGQGAIFDVPVGEGRIIAFTFDPLHRYLNLHDASLVWNVLINWDYLRKVKL